MLYLIKGLRLALGCLLLNLGLKNSADAALTATSLAIIGYDDGMDSFSTLALEDILAGEEIYFTNNGWSSSRGMFNGADPSQGAGSESLIKLTVNQTISRGTVISSNATHTAWAWTKSGLIPGQVGGMGEFSDLMLDFESDQIYAFQAFASNPLLNPTHFLYALHFGSVDYPGFSDAEDLLTGDIPPGLSLAAKTAFAHTDFAFHGDADGNNSAWSLNMNALEVQQLQSSGGNAQQWRNAISNSSNWGAGSVGTGFFQVTPEPSRALLLLAGLAVLIGQRRRNIIYHLNP
jgi:hypothetical protein